ncbi:MAG TPA: nuclear transport factor 2 family protein [Candidatus Bathyarchaeia archaeon]|nr:nuclear transport factor 2 family protein [Candidatus Bathyarchaeia archaeon]
MDSKQSAREVVMSYIEAMDNRNYDAVRNYLDDTILVRGPAGEAFRNREEFINMMQKQHGKYDMKKIFVDENDVCLLYNFITKTVATFFCSWYQVKDGKIVSIQTVFDPRAFATTQGKDGNKE